MEKDNKTKGLTSRQTTKDSSNKAYTNSSKKIPSFIWVVIGIVLFAGVAYATTVNEQLISTPTVVYGNGTNGFGNFSGTRELVNTGTRTVTVCDSGCDFTTINSAMFEAPYFAFHRYIVNVTSPYTANEAVFIPPSVTSSDMAAADGASGGILLQGNCANINQIQIRSVHVISSTGSLNPYVRCFSITGVDPGNNEDAAVVAFGSQDAAFQALNFTLSNATNGIMAYASGVSAAGIDLGPRLRNAFLTKHTGRFHFEDSPQLITGWTNATCNVIGNTSNSIYDNQGGLPIGFSKNCATAPNIAYTQRAPVFDITNGIAYGFNTIIDGLKVKQDANPMLWLIENGSARNSSFRDDGNGNLIIKQNALAGTNVLIQIDPVAFGSSTSGVRFFRDTNTTGSKNFQLFRGDGSGTVDAQIGVNGSNSIFQGGGGRFVINGSGLAQVSANTTGVTCSALTSGSIYYDGVVGAHFGCNVTGWQRMY